MGTCKHWPDTDKSDSRNGIAALFVATGGAYFGLPGVIPWDEERDARGYLGPYPVVAHPPCERWGRYWGVGPMLHGTPSQKELGDDGGCFASAISSVRAFGGVLEHPEAQAIAAGWPEGTPTMALDGTMARVSYGVLQRLAPEGYVVVDLADLARRHDAGAPVWVWLASHGIARAEVTCG
jgi:hypothetical protein